MIESVAAGWDALSQAAWADALALIRDAEDDPEALEVAAVAHWWLDHADATLDARERAYRLYQERHDHLGAARVASALAWDVVLFGGRTAVAQGWLDRAARLLEHEEAGPEHAWLAVREAEVSLAAGEPDVARAAAQRAISLATSLCRDDVEVVGRSLEGLSLVHEGRVREGMRRLDESAVAATAGDVKDLMWVGKVCCNLIVACEAVGDVERATQWCAQVKDLAERWELQTLFNVCRAQYAAVLIQSGSWQEGETELQAALTVLAEGRRTSLSDGIAQLGELRRRQGRLDEARALFARSERSWVSLIGSAELALDEDDAPAALALAERLERTTEEGRRVERVAVLSLLARAASTSGRSQHALEALVALDEAAECVDTNAARATAAYAGGEHALASGEPERARRRFEDAVDLLTHSAAPYELAQARLALARVLFRLGPPTRARAEARRAREAFSELGARGGELAAARLLRRSGPSEVADSSLTPRERQVLALIAAGRSNREIATELVVSPHTAHRHVANILRKLGEPTRAAAAARAARDGLA